MHIHEWNAFGGIKLGISEGPAFIPQMHWAQPVTIQPYPDYPAHNKTLNGPKFIN